MDRMDEHCRRRLRSLLNASSLGCLVDWKTAPLFWTACLEEECRFWLSESSNCYRKGKNEEEEKTIKREVSRTALVGLAVYVTFHHACVDVLA